MTRGKLNDEIFAGGTKGQSHQNQAQRTLYVHERCSKWKKLQLLTVAKFDHV
jgi:hypothetical protein